MLQDDGFIAQLLVGDGANNIDVNTPLAVIVEDKVTWLSRIPCFTAAQPKCCPCSSEASMCSSFWAAIPQSVNWRSEGSS